MFDFSAVTRINHARPAFNLLSELTKAAFSPFFFYLFQNQNRNVASLIGISQKCTAEHIQTHRFTYKFCEPHKKKITFHRFNIEQFDRQQSNRYPTHP